MFEHVVVPLDGSALAEAALPPAADLARACAATLVLVSAVDRVDDVAARQRQVERWAPVLDVDAVEVAVRAEVRPSTAIAEAAAGRPSIVCMATHGRSGIGRAVLGSVAEATLGEVERPMLLVGQACPSFASPVLGDVLAWVEPTPAGTSVVEVATAWAATFGQALEVVAAGAGAGASERLRRDLLRRAEARRPSPPVVRIEALAGHRPSRAVAGLLAERSPGLVVVGTERRRSLTRPVAAGVSMRVVHDAPCPVLLVPTSAPG